jgi:predicted DsbA family dithiol-disulfide isomerase
MPAELKIYYYTDVLCVWAWIAQRRKEELETVWGDKLDLHHLYVNVFGDTHTRMETQWADRGGFDGFSSHVVDSAAPYDNAPVNPDVWSKVRPRTSSNAHLVIKAAAKALSEQTAAILALEIRRSFFVDALDIGQLPVLYEIVERLNIDSEAVRRSVSDGSATAALMSDYQRASEQDISGSPSWVMNDGRQKLYGNIGYHVLNANVEGLLSQHGDEASWC